MNISDTHNDFLTKLAENKSLNYLKKCELDGVKHLLASVFTSEYSQEHAAYKINVSSHLINSYGNPNYKMHIEDLGFIKTSQQLSQVLKANPFSCSLTWNCDNQFAGGNFGINSLSKKGSALIKTLLQNNIVLDTAHLNRKSFARLIKITTRPIFCSHTGLCFIKKSPRNLTHSQIQTIIDSNGYFGLFLSPTFMTQNGIMDCQTFAQIIYKTLAKYGDSNFGIGSDFFGIQNPKGNLQSYSDFVAVSTILTNMGISKSTQEKIFYKNFVNCILNAK